MEQSILNPQDETDCKEACLRFVRSFAVNEPVPLYHYTHGDNLIKIIDSGELWTTQIGCLNDAKEIGHAMDLLRGAIGRLRKAGANSEVAILLAALEAELDSANPARSRAFVACFSERSDDLRADPESLNLR
jgi:hypothetical protein